jgi:hypothetical protein
VVAIDMQKKTLEDLAPFSVERCMYDKPDYVACALSKYLNTNSGDSYAGNSNHHVSTISKAIHLTPSPSSVGLCCHLGCYTTKIV